MLATNIRDGGVEGLLINQDYQFNYLLIGDRHRPVILILHGFMGNCHDFTPVVAGLQDFCCLLVDLPGHGQTEVRHDANYQMPNVALALVTLLDELAIEQCWLWGYSMGGRIALYLAVYFPQYFRGVFLESTSPGLKTPQERELRCKQDFQLAQQLESTPLSQFIDQWYQNPLFQSLVQHPDYPQVLSNRLVNEPMKLAKSLRYCGLAIQPSLWNYLSTLQIPLILIVGSLDTKFMAINEQIRALCPQASLKIINHSGHNVHFEQPLAVIRLLTTQMRFVISR